MEGSFLCITYYPLMNNNDNISFTNIDMAPEVLLHTQFSRAADVWSYGACLIEILTDQKPYHEYETLSYLEVNQTFLTIIY